MLGRQHVNAHHNQLVRAVRMSKVGQPCWLRSQLGARQFRTQSKILLFAAPMRRLSMLRTAVVALQVRPPSLFEACKQRMLIIHMT